MNRLQKVDLCNRVDGQTIVLETPFQTRFASEKIPFQTNGDLLPYSEMLTYCL